MVLAVRRSVMAIVLAVRHTAVVLLRAALFVVAVPILALRGVVVGTYGVARRLTSHLAHWIRGLGARVVEGTASVGMSAISGFRRVALDLRSRGRAFWRRCGVATMLIRARLTGTFGAVARVMRMARRRVSLAARSLHKRGGASLRGLVRRVQKVGIAVSRIRMPAGQRLGMQMPLPLDGTPVRRPVANLTLAAFGGGTAVGALIMWFAGVVPAPPELTNSAPPRPTASDPTRLTDSAPTRLTGSEVSLVSGVVAPPADDRGAAVYAATATTEPADDRGAPVYAATSVTKPADDAGAAVQHATPVPAPIEPQERAPVPVSTPTVAQSTAITVTSAPAGARVTVDGIGWGETPVTIRNLPPGQKVIRVTKEGYQSQQQTISVADDPHSSGVRVILRARQ
jgi:hypothetical protein